jgi:hypothetical protein
MMVISNQERGSRMKKAILIGDIEWLLSYLDIQSIQKLKKEIEQMLDDNDYQIEIVERKYARD